MLSFKEPYTATVEALPLLAVGAVSYCRQCTWYFVTYATFSAPLGHWEWLLRSHLSYIPPLKEVGFTKGNCKP